LLRLVQHKRRHVLNNARRLPRTRLWRAPTPDAAEVVRPAPLCAQTAVRRSYHGQEAEHGHVVGPDKQQLGARLGEDGLERAADVVDGHLEEDLVVLPAGNVHALEEAILAPAGTPKETRAASLARSTVDRGALALTYVGEQGVKDEARAGRLGCDQQDGAGPREKHPARLALEAVQPQARLWSSHTVAL